MMKMKTPLAAMLVLLITVGLSGCLGGGGGGDNEPEFEELTGEINKAGSVTGLAQAQPEELTDSVDFPVDSDMITEITFTIEVQDGDQNTNPDSVDQVVITGGNQSVTVNGGATPYERDGKLTWDGTNTMNGNFSLEITVTIEAGDDQWPGPLFWYGVPDRGFSYNIYANYTYLQQTNT